MGQLRNRDTLLPDGPTSYFNKIAPLSLRHLSDTQKKFGKPL